MKQKKRQNVLIVGAGLSMLIVFSQLFGGGGDHRTMRATTLNTDTPEANISEEREGVVPPPTARSGFYQNVQRRLQTFIPEQADAFAISEFGADNPKSTLLSTGAGGGIPNSELGALPPLPIPRSGGAIRELPLQGSEFVDKENRKAEERGDKKMREGEDEKTLEERQPNIEGSDTRTPRLRAFVCDAGTNSATALIEWEGALLQVGTEVGSEWQIVSYNKESIVVKRGDERWELKRE
jgi:hypothetical protein